MKNIQILITITLVFILSTTAFAQVENTMKETKVKVEKMTKKAAVAKEMATDVMKGKKCDTDCKKACCGTEAKDMKAEMKNHGADCKCDGCSTAATTMKKGEKMMKKAHAKDCDCEGCKTASATMHDGYKVMKNTHAEGCDCEGCKVAQTEMKEHKHKAHAKDCSCKSCAKT